MVHTHPSPRRRLPGVRAALLLIATLLAAAPGAPAQTWSAVYGNSYDHLLRSVHELPDGTWILGGTGYPRSAGNLDLWVVRADGAGEILWQRWIGGAADESGGHVVPTADGGFLVVGSTSSQGAGGRDGLVVGLEADGSVAWQRTVGGPGDDELVAVVPLADGRFLAAGRSDSAGAGSEDAWLLQLSATGAVLWSRVYGGSSFDVARDLVPLGDGAAFVGSTWSEGAGRSDLWIGEVDAAGDLLSSRIYGGPLEDDGTAITHLGHLQDGGFAVAGSTRSFSQTEYSDLWMLRVDPGGAVPWQKVLGSAGYDEATEVTVNQEGRLTVVGETDLFSATRDTDLWFLDVSLDIGTVVTQRAYGGSGPDRGETVGTLADGGYWLAGWSYSFGDPDGSDYWLFTTEGDGTTGGSCPDPIPTSAQAGTTSAAGADFQAEVAKLVASVAPFTGNGIAQEPVTHLVCRDCSSGGSYGIDVYGVEGHDVALGVRALPDGGALTWGWSDSTGAGHEDAWLLWTTETRQPLWSTLFGGKGDERVVDVEPLETGGWMALVASDAASIAEGSVREQVWLLRVGSTGQLRWGRRYAGPISDRPSDLILTPDGGFLVVGRTDSFGSGSADGLALRLDAAGDVVWQFAYGGPGLDTLSGGRTTPDGRFLLGGSTDSFGGGDLDGWFLALESDGTVAASMTYGGADDDTLGSAAWGPDGELVMAGATRSFGSKLRDVWTVAVDRDGIPLWSRAYGGPADERAENPVIVNDGTLVLPAMTVSKAGDLDPWLLGLADDGRPLWQRTLVGSFSEEITAVAPGPHCELLATGARISSSDPADAWLLRLASNGKIPGCDRLKDLNLPDRPVSPATAKPPVVRSPADLRPDGLNPADDNLPLWWFGGC